MRREVREMEFGEVDLMIDYFLNSDIEHLDRLGVDRSKLPDARAWREMLREDFESDYENRKTYYVLWLLDDAPVGHSHIGKIVYGEEAYMHLHLWDPGHRRKGNGRYFVTESIRRYFENFRLQNLYCEPHAFNDAPNRTLDRTGFTFVKKYETTPGWINVHQWVNRWVLTRECHDALLAGTASESADA